MFRAALVLIGFLFWSACPIITIFQTGDNAGTFFLIGLGCFVAAAALNGIANAVALGDKVDKLEDELDDLKKNERAPRRR